MTADSDLIVPHQAASSEAFELGIGRRIARYEIESVLGRSGSALVVRARDPNLSRQVLLKLLDPTRIADQRLSTADWIALFKREARLVGRLQHPLIPAVYDAGRGGDIYFIALSLIEGDTLSEMLARGELLASEHLRAIASDLAEALDHIHGHGLVHCDVRASNVMISKDGRAELIDFSLAQEQGGPEHPLLASNLLTASPEYLSGFGYTPRSDQFALGGLIYQMLVGRRPFEASDQRDLIEEIQSRPALPPASIVGGVDPVLSEIALRLLEKDPARRFDRCLRLKERLRGSDASPRAPEPPDAQPPAAFPDTTPSMVLPPVPPEAFAGPLVALFERASGLAPPVDGISAPNVARVIARRLGAGARAEMHAPIAVAARELAARLRISPLTEPISSLVPLEVATLIANVDRLLTDPAGAGGKAAPIAAQIAAVVEAYFTATRPRDGFKRLSPRRAILELRQEAGRHLESDVVKALINHLREVISALDLDGLVDSEAQDSRRNVDRPR